MGKHSLEEFIKKENEGVVFAKITKSFKSNDLHGNYFPYEDYIGKIINSKVSPLFKQSTIEPINVAFGYFHYGDQLTIVNFKKLAEIINPKEFIAYDNFKSDRCYDVNSLYVEKVLSLDEISTIDLFRKYMLDDEFFNNIQISIKSLERWKCYKSVEYLNKCWTEKIGTREFPA
nr:hypothetical protein [uncultured Agathobacter sp.]